MIKHNQSINQSNVFDASICTNQGRGTCRRSRRQRGAFPSRRSSKPTGCCTSWCWKFLERWTSLRSLAQPAIWWEPVSTRCVYCGRDIILFGNQGGKRRNKKQEKVKEKTAGEKIKKGKNKREVRFLILLCYVLFWSGCFAYWCYHPPHLPFFLLYCNNGWCPLKVLYYHSMSYPQQSNCR